MTGREHLLFSLHQAETCLFLVRLLLLLRRYTLRYHTHSWGGVFKERHDSHLLSHRFRSARFLSICLRVFVQATDRVVTGWFGRLRKSLNMDIPPKILRLLLFGGFAFCFFLSVANRWIGHFEWDGMRLATAISNGVTRFILRILQHLLRHNIYPHYLF